MNCSFCPNDATYRIGEYRLCDGHYEWALNEGFAWPVEVDCA